MLFLLAVPLGLVLLRGVEWFLGRALALSVPERLLIAFYGAGMLLFVVASVPLAAFGLLTVVVLFAAGIVFFAVISLRARGTNITAALNFVRSLPGAVLLLGSLGLLVVELWGALVSLPNGVDGTVYALFVNVVLRNHEIVWTLAPYARSGIIYPQGAPVWMAVPVLLYGWPIVAAPVVLPPLFLSLTPAAGYALGHRLSPITHLPRTWSGLTFAAFFGLVASWPRLYVAGSYDFIFALPAFLVALGLVTAFAGSTERPWREVAVLGALLGGLSALSLAVGTALLLLLAALWLASAVGAGRRALASAAVRFVTVVGIAMAFVARGVIGVVVWFGYPGHVLTQTGSPPYSPIVSGNTYSGWGTQLDPFVPWKPKISPFPPTFLVLEALLIAGLFLALLVLVARPSWLTTRLPYALVRWVLVGTSTLFLETALLLAIGSLNGSVSGIQSISNVWETSFLLFMFYSLIGLLPIVVAVHQFTSARGHDARTVPEARAGPPATPRPSIAGARARHLDWKVVGALVIVGVPLLTGAACTVAYVPSYAHSSIVAEANSTSSDLAGLQWAGSHLPSCSDVLVAPGSAAQFLPEFAVAHLIFPVFPSPTNLSYHHLYDDFVNGTYTAADRAALRELNVTEVFVTGQTTNAYPAFRTAQFLSSSDFTVLFAEGDALIVEFVPGVTGSGCAPG